AIPWCPWHLRDNTISHGRPARYSLPHVFAGSWTPRVARARADVRAPSPATEGIPHQGVLKRPAPPLPPPLPLLPNHPTAQGSSLGEAREDCRANHITMRLRMPPTRGTIHEREYRSCFGDTLYLRCHTIP